MNKMWAGRSQKETDKLADEFNSSIAFDSRMFRQDITGSIAHADMLAKCGILNFDEVELIKNTLKDILADIQSGALAIDENAEDIHMFVEAELTNRIGDAGKRLHTARSRNDQVAVDLRLYLRDETDSLIELLYSLINSIYNKAYEYKAVIMPGYTHLQRAQPVTFGHHLSAYCMMLIRDIGRLKDARARMNYSPLGSCALAGTTYPTDSALTAESLGFYGYMQNSMDGVSDRDYCVELLSALATLMMHLSRFSEEIILWSSWEFKFIELDDAYTTGSSIMPQKKNPDMAELVRGKTGRVYGDLITMLTVLKGIPLAYNKDMQEDKECIFDAFDTAKAAVAIFTPMIATMKAIPENMLSAAKKGFINATDLADYLVGKGLPFRTAYKIVGMTVAKCSEMNITLDELPIDEYKKMHECFDDDLYNAISLETCVNKRISKGSTGPDSVIAELEYIKTFLCNK